MVKSYEHGEYLGAPSGSEGNKLDRRSLVIGATGAAAIGFAAFKGFNLGSNEKVAIIDNSGRSSNQQEPASEPKPQKYEAVAPNSLDVDLTTRPMDINMFVGQEHLNPELAQEAFEAASKSGDMQSFSEFYYTSKDEVLTDTGEVDLGKASQRYLDAFIKGVRTFQTPENLQLYINDPIPGRFVMDKTAADLDIVRGIGGFTKPEFSDEQVMSYSLYKEFRVAHAAALKDYFLNAQSENGNLNTIFNIELLDHDLINKLNYSPNAYAVALEVNVSNTVTTKNPPLNRIDIPGRIDISVNVEEDSGIVLFHRGGSSIVSPIDQYAEEVA